jgi:phage terminase small subunit
MRGDKRPRRKEAQKPNLTGAATARVSPSPEFTAEELEVWARVMDSKSSEFWLPCDQDYLHNYCQAVVRVRKVQAKVLAQGSVLQTKYGPKANPLLFEQERLERWMMMLGQRLQLLPISRNHVDRASEDGRYLMKRREIDAAEKLKESDGLLASPMVLQ